MENIKKRKPKIPALKVVGRTCKQRIMTYAIKQAIIPFLFAY